MRFQVPQKKGNRLKRHVNRSVFLLITKLTLKYLANDREIRYNMVENVLVVNKMRKEWINWNSIKLF